MAVFAPKTLVVASNNPGKLREIAEFVERAPIAIRQDRLDVVAHDERRNLARTRDFREFRRFAEKIDGLIDDIRSGTFRGSGDAPLAVPGRQPTLAEAAARIREGDERLEVVHLSGRAGRYLRLGEGEIAAVLDRVALDMPHVAIGSYPMFDRSLDHVVKVTVESVVGEQIRIVQHRIAERGDAALDARMVSRAPGSSSSCRP